MRNLILKTVVAVTAGLSLAGCGGNSGVEVSVPKSTIQEAVDEWLPVSSSTSDSGPEVTLTKATVILREGSDKIGFELAIEVTLPDAPLRSDGRQRPGVPAPGTRVGKANSPPGLPTPPGRLPTGGESPEGKIQGTIVVLVGIRYDADEAAFYCEKPAIEKIEIARLPDKLSPAVARLSEKLMTGYFQKSSVYRLDDKTTTNRLAKATLRSVVVRDGQLMVKVGL